MRWNNFEITRQLAEKLGLWSGEVRFRVAGGVVRFELYGRQAQGQEPYLLGTFFTVRLADFIGEAKAFISYLTNPTPPNPTIDPLSGLEGAPKQHESQEEAKARVGKASEFEEVGF